MAEINITPMVDVMLVLLIIFMVAAPLMVAGVPVELPKTSAARVGQSKKPMVVTLTADGRLQIRNEFVGRDQLVPRLQRDPRRRGRRRHLRARRQEGRLRRRDGDPGPRRAKRLRPRLASVAARRRRARHLRGRSRSRCKSFAPCPGFFRSGCTPDCCSPSSASTGGAALDAGTGSDSSWSSRASRSRASPSSARPRR